MLSDKSRLWGRRTDDVELLLEVVVTPAAISCSPDKAYSLQTLTNRHPYPWLLLNFRNPVLQSCRRYAEVRGLNRDHQGLSEA
jgi:hypothetical protein